MKSPSHQNYFINTDSTSLCCFNFFLPQLLQAEYSIFYFDTDKHSS